MLYSLYLFDRHCQCVFYTEWNRPGASRSMSDDQRTQYVWPTQHGSSEPRKDAAMVDEAKLVYGVIYSLKSMVAKLSATAGSDQFLSYRTNTYKLHYFETASGLKFVLTSDPATSSLREVLKQIYLHIYLEYVVKNALVPADPNRSLPIANDYFCAVLNNYIKGLACFQS
ncbi:TRAPP complex subunit bet5 [Dimargaris xerosporica]|nr:TRAPP complex subunit bet5 [Dimargaris xerosporica]